VIYKDVLGSKKPARSGDCYPWRTVAILSSEEEGMVSHLEALKEGEQPAG
jgi:hypothetical protein